MRVSDYIAEHLRRIGVDKVFLLSGGGMMHLIDAIGRARMPYLCCHHEQACAMAAEGYARRRGGLGVCYATSGPGATNTLTGLVGAWQDSSPVLFLTGQSKRSQTIRHTRQFGLRQYGTFEVDIIPMVESVTKMAHFLDDPADVRWVLERAIHLATSGRPGPVLIDVPLDVQSALIDLDRLTGYDPAIGAVETLKSDWAALAAAVGRAKRPLLLIGHGVRCAGATDKLRDVVVRLGWPVVTTQLAKDALPYDNPSFVGHPGPKGDRAGNFALQSADLIISIGCSLHSQTVGYEADLFAPAAFKVQTDIDQAVLDRGDVSVNLRIAADVPAVLNLLGSLLVASTTDWLARCQRWKEEYAVAREPHVVNTQAINFYEFAAALSAGMHGDETIVTDAGSAFYVLGQAFQCRDSQRYIVSGAMGSMGFALPAAIGAATTGTGNVVCVTGDGSLQTNIQELATLRHYGLAVKLFVIDNDGYASIRNTQRGFFEGKFVGASSDSGVSIPPLEGIARSYDLPFINISSRDKLATGIAEALAVPGPVVVRVNAQPDQAIIPAVASRKTPEGGLRSDPLHKMSPALADKLVDRQIAAGIDEAAP